MAFVPPCFAVQHLEPVQMHYPQPQFLQLPPHVQVVSHPPVSIMVPTMVVAQPPLFTPPCFFVAPAQPPPPPPSSSSSSSSSSSDQPARAAAAAVNLPKGLTLRVIFHDHASNDDYTPPLCVSSAVYEDDDSLPSRDALLAGIATWAGHHGLAIQHPGGRIDPFRAKLYVLPPKRSGCKGCGFGHEPGVGLVVPADVIRVVGLGSIDEKDWEEALREIKREGYGGVVAVDMGVGGLHLNTATTTTTTTSTASTPEPMAAAGGAAA